MQARPRRALFQAVALGCLAGCGFRAQYAPVSAGADLRRELAAVRIGDIPERAGQLLRRDLQRRFEGAAPGTPARYRLDVSLAFGAEVLGYRADGGITRVRYTATGSWALSTVSVPRGTLGRSALPFRAIDSFNVPDLQFFAGDTSRDSAELRLVETVAEDVYRQVASLLAMPRGMSERSG
jgi:LPS-assembly lipoprotein